MCVHVSVYMCIHPYTFVCTHSLCAPYMHLHVCGLALYFLVFVSVHTDMHASCTYMHTGICVFMDTSPACVLSYMQARFLIHYVLCPSLYTCVLCVPLYICGYVCVRACVRPLLCAMCSHLCTFVNISGSHPCCCLGHVHIEQCGPEHVLTCVGSQVFSVHVVQ